VGFDLLQIIGNGIRQRCFRGGLGFVLDDGDASGLRFERLLALQLRDEGELGVRADRLPYAAATFEVAQMVDAVRKVDVLATDRGIPRF
jgi:hypothetical protein